MLFYERMSPKEANANQTTNSKASLENVQDHIAQIELSSELAEVIIFLQTFNNICIAYTFFKLCKLFLFLNISIKHNNLTK